jgi:hypothetical protein
MINAPGQPCPSRELIVAPDAGLSFVVLTRAAPKYGQDVVIIGRSGRPVNAKRLPGSGLPRLRKCGEMVAALTAGEERRVHCIYEIRYEIQWHTSGPAQWEPQVVRVLAGLDAQEAIDKARHAALRQHQMNDNGVEERCTGFRLREVALVAEAML